MQAPSSFVRRLAQEHAGRLRIRWSIAWSRWEIEQKVGRAAFLPLRVSEIDDSRIRARDGYAPLLSVTPGTTMPCPRCRMKLEVPSFEFREIICDYCRFKGRDGGLMAAYWPLDGEGLLEHLRKIDPFRGRDAKVQAKEADLHNTRRDQAIDKKTDNEGFDYLWDAALTQLPKVGYTTPTSFEEST